MEFLIADKDRYDVGALAHSAYVDMDVGKDNDFKIEVSLRDYVPELHAPGNIVYSLGTEYGGVLDDPESSTSDKKMSFTGDSFRGLLSKRYILPPSGEAYRYMTGELNACIRDTLDGLYDGLFKASNIDTGVSVRNYQINRYCSVLDGLTAMLASVGYRLSIQCVQPEDQVYVEVSAVPIVDYSAEIETSQDSGINFTIKRYTNRYNYMLCLGKGELTDRVVVMLHCADNGTITEVSSIPDGADVRVYKYDYSSAESRADLIKSATEQFAEINKTDTQKLTVKDDMQLELGDIIGGRDYVTGMTIAQPISQKIIKVTNGILKLSYSVGNGD